jgi:hypothetical protein
MCTFVSTFCLHMLLPWLFQTQKINLKARVEVFAAACHGAGLTAAAARISGGPHRQHHSTQSHCSADAAEIEAILLGLQPAVAPSKPNSGSKENTNNIIREASAGDDSSSSSSSIDPASLACKLQADSLVPNNPLDEAVEALPSQNTAAAPQAVQPQTKNKLFLVFNSFRSKRQAPAAAAVLPAKPSKGNTHASSDSRRSSDSNSGGEMGEDACPYKFTLPKAFKPLWLLGTSRKALKQHQQQRDMCNTPATASPPEAAKTTPARHSSGTPGAGTGAVHASDGNIRSVMGEDPCPHKDALPRPVKSSWLLGASRKASKKQQGMPATSTAATPTLAAPAAAAATAGAAPNNRKVSQRCRNAWNSFCSRLRPKISQGGAAA